MEALLTGLLARVAFTAIASLLSWRVWRFTIRPRFYPQEPKELPYWIPCKNRTTLEYFLPSREPFSMTIAGETIYIATSAKDVNDVWSSSKTISINPIAEQMHVAAGLSKEQANFLFQVHHEASYNVNKVKPVIPNQYFIELHHQQLHPGPELEELIKGSAVPSIIEHLNFPKGAHPAVIQKEGKAIIIEAYYGPKMLEMFPNLSKDFTEWEHVAWKLLFSLPSFLSGDMVTVKQNLFGSLATYLRLPRNERPDEAPFVTRIEDMLREHGFDEDLIGTCLFFHFWAINGNVYKLAFWLTAHLSQDPELMQQIREEVQPATKIGSIDDTFLSEKCPALSSLVDETLRLTVTSSLARQLLQTTVIGGKTLEKGRKIMLPIRGLHYDESIWGASPDTLHPKRFLENPKMAKNTSFRPWGGGHTLCPGRFLARRMVNVFVAELLSKYEIGVESNVFPRGDGARPAPGVIPWRKGDDVLLRLTPRGVRT
ncbi:putative cytochrome P450 [Polyplosphaeria fusca]|uniref:Cytochrome P450 n=1 Tax=Polyplosphaeria fusca TaxID=682080 RepID=A0A9P4UXL2_9PLEO|nr:putative cytochrome P450 [Polyplosphaeria fusca]